MTQQHPIKPPLELVQQWLTDGHHQDHCVATEHALTQAAQWGADKELQACCTWLSLDWVDPATIEHLCAYRRPKKEEAD